MGKYGVVKGLSWVDKFGEDEVVGEKIVHAVVIDVSGKVSSFCGI